MEQRSIVQENGTDGAPGRGGKMKNGRIIPANISIVGKLFLFAMVSK
jgi:hypothetical protein